MKYVQSSRYILGSNIITIWILLFWNSFSIYHLLLIIFLLSSIGTFSCFGKSEQKPRLKINRKFYSLNLYFKSVKSGFLPQAARFLAGPFPRRLNLRLWLPQPLRALIRYRKANPLIRYRKANPLIRYRKANPLIRYRKANPLIRYRKANPLIRYRKANQNRENV